MRGPAELDYEFGNDSGAFVLFVLHEQIIAFRNYLDKAVPSILVSLRY